jgi:cold shock CspA family protein
VLRANLRVHAVYAGWFFVGRPPVEELRHDLRAVMATCADYRYEADNTPEVRRIRIPQQEWANGAPPLGVSGLPVRRGRVRWFETVAGVGELLSEQDEPVFFHFTAIPGEGYRTRRVGTTVQYELVDHPTGPTTRNIQALTD